MKILCVQTVKALKKQAFSKNPYVIMNSFKRTIKKFIEMY